MTLIDKAREILLLNERGGILSPLQRDLLTAYIAQYEALEESETDLACYDGDPKYPAKKRTLKTVRAALALSTKEVK